MSGRGHRGAPVERGGGSSRPYKVLCVSSLHPKASDDVVRDTLYREYKKYGDISVRVVLDPDGRYGISVSGILRLNQRPQHAQWTLIEIEKKFNETFT